MTTLWLCITATAVASFAIKAAGPALLGSNPLPERARGPMTLLAPALLSGLVIADLLGPRWRSFDPALVMGVAVAAFLRLARVPELPAVLAAVVVAAGARAVMG